PRYRRRALRRRSARSFPESPSRLAGARAPRPCSTDQTGYRSSPDRAGVSNVLTASDVPGEGDSGAARHDEPLFPTEIMFHQQPVAWVLGETLEAARLGAARVQAEYQTLPAILTIQEAIAAQSFLSGPMRIVRGDASGALTNSPHRIEGELVIGGQEHFYLET